MKSLRWVLLVGYCSGASLAFAQSSPTYPQKQTMYLGTDGAVVADPKSAHHRLDITFRDSVSGSIREYDATGKLTEITPYADIDHLVKLGPKTTYYLTGQMRTKEDFVGNKRQGQYLMFSPEGKLKRRETYAADVRIGGECFNIDGQQVPFFEYEVMPSYKGGGTDQMMRAIYQNIRYPYSSLRFEDQGRIFVSFRVTETGGVDEVSIVRGVSDALDRAVLAAVRKLSGFTPGMRDGQPVSVSFTLPITFKIEGSSDFSSPAQQTADFMNSRPLPR